MKYINITLSGLLILLLFTACGNMPAANGDSNLAAAYYDLGNTYYKLKKYDQAIPYFQKAITLNPELIQAHYNLALALIHYNKGEEADRLIKGLLEKDRENIELLHVLGYSYYMQNKFTQSLAAFDEVLALAPKNTDALYNKGMVLWKIKKFDEAAELFKQVIAFMEAEQKANAANPLYQKTLYGLGELLLENKKQEQSAFYLERYLELAKEDLAAHRLLIKSYRELEKYARVLDVYEHLLAVNPDSASDWLGKAEVLLTKVADPINGLAAFNKALMLGISKDDSQLQQLVNAPDLIEKDKIKALITERNKLTAH